MITMYSNRICYYQGELRNLKTPMLLFTYLLSFYLVYCNIILGRSLWDHGEASRITSSVWCFANGVQRSWAKCEQTQHTVYIHLVQLMWLILLLQMPRTNSWAGTNTEISKWSKSNQRITAKSSISSYSRCAAVSNMYLVTKASRWIGRKWPKTKAGNQRHDIACDWGSWERIR